MCSSPVQWPSVATVVAERIKALRPGIRVLFMSGYAQPVLASGPTLDTGVVLIGRPFTQQGLLAKVRDVLDRPVSAS
jgi:hypothetical protein